MKTAAQLRQERAEAIELAHEVEAKAEEEGRELTPEQKSEVSAYLSRAEGLDMDIERRTRLEAAQAALAAPEKKKVSLPVGEVQAMPMTIAGMDISKSYRVGQLKAFKNDRDGYYQAYKVGHWISAALFGRQKSIDWCRENGYGDIRAAMSGNINTAGGVLVPEEMSQSIIDLREQYGVFRRYARVYPMGSDSINIPRRTAGLSTYFVGEGGEGTESDIAWDNVQLTSKKLMALTRVSSELDEDAIINLADFVSSEIAWAFAYKEDLCGFLGTGTSTYGGIYGVAIKIIDGNHAASVVTGATDHDTFAEIDLDDLTNVMGACPVYARMGAAWYISQTGADVVFGNLSAAAGGNTIQSLAGAFTPSFLGYPIVVSQVLPTSTGDLSGSTMLLFGNLSMAVAMGDRRGIRIMTTMDRYWETDQVGIKGTQRFDINCHSLGDGTTAGPIIALKGH